MVSATTSISAVLYLPSPYFLLDTCLMRFQLRGAIDLPNRFQDALGSILGRRNCADVNTVDGFVSFLRGDERDVIPRGSEGPTLLLKDPRVARLMD